MNTDMRNHSSDSLDHSRSHSGVETAMLRRRSTSVLHLTRQYDGLASTDSALDSGIRISGEDHMKLLQRGHVRRPSCSSLRRRDPRPGGASSQSFRRAASLEEDDMIRRPYSQLVLKPLYLPKAVQELRRCSTPQDNKTVPTEDGDLENRRSKEQQAMEPTSDSEQPYKTLRRRSRLSRPWSIPLPVLSPVHDEPRRPSDPGPTTEAQASKSGNHWRASRTMSLVPLHTSKSPSPADLMLLQAVSDAAKSKRKLRGLRYEWHEEELEGFTSPMLTVEPSAISMEAVSSVTSDCSPFSGPLPNGILTWGSSVGSCISTDTSHCWCSPRSTCVALRGTASSGSISTDGVPSLFGDNDPRAYHHPSGPQTPVSSNEDNLFSSLTNATFDIQGLPSIPSRPASVHSLDSSNKHHNTSATDPLDVIDTALIIVRGTSPSRHWEEEEEESPALAESSAHGRPSDVSSISLLDLTETEETERSEPQEEAIERPRPSSQLERRTDTRDFFLSSSSQSQCLPGRDVLRRVSTSSVTCTANFAEATVVKGQPLHVQLNLSQGRKPPAQKQPTHHAIGQDHPHRTGLGPEVIHRRLRSMGETVDHVRLSNYQASLPPRPRTGLDRQRPHTRTGMSVATERNFENSISVFEDEQESSSLSWRGKVATGQRHKTTMSSRLVQPLTMLTGRGRPSLSLAMPKRPSTSTGIVGAAISRVASLSRPTAPPPPRSPSSLPNSPADRSPRVAASSNSMANRMKQLPPTPKTPSASLLSYGLRSGLGLGVRHNLPSRSGSIGKSGKVKRDSLVDVFQSPRWQMDTSTSMEERVEGLWATHSANDEEGSRRQPTATAVRRRLTERMRR